jgi:hypothetical protein
MIICGLCERQIRNAPKYWSEYKQQWFHTFKQHCNKVGK